MNRFWGVLCYEYRMSIRRWSFWIAFGLLFVPYGVVLVSSAVDPAEHLIALDAAWGEIGRVVYTLNMTMPVFAGIVIADRLVRDNRLGVTELLQSTALSRRAYILGKYAAGFLSTLTPVALATGIASVFALANGAPLWSLPVFLLAFAAITVPAYLFVAAFSLACPLVIPVRVYQILFTGYWFWGNYLNPKAFPSLNGTLLTPGGIFALEGFFGVSSSKLLPGEVLRTPLEAALNLAVLAGCVVIVLAALDRYLAWRGSRA